jgi:hypothetical protein
MLSLDSLQYKMYLDNGRPCWFLCMGFLFYVVFVTHFKVSVSPYNYITSVFHWNVTISLILIRFIVIPCHLFQHFHFYHLKKKLISDTVHDTDVHKQTVNFRYALIVCSYIMHFCRKYNVEKWHKVKFFF